MGKYLKTDTYLHDRPCTIKNITLQNNKLVTIIFWSSKFYVHERPFQLINVVDPRDNVCSSSIILQLLKFWNIGEIEGKKKIQS